MKLQILTCATKVLVLTPSNPQLTLLQQYLFNLARYDQDYDVRDRGRYLAALVRGITADQADEEPEMGGVILRREQIKLVLFGQRSTRAAQKAIVAGYEIGTLSAVLNRKVLGYEALPEWTDDPTDGHLRESEVRVCLQTSGTFEDRAVLQEAVCRSGCASGGIKESMTRREPEEAHDNIKCEGMLQEMGRQEAA